MKKINFRALPCEMVDGSIDEIDLSKELANLIYSQTKECGEAMFAQELYKNGEVELTEENEKTIRKYADNFVYFVTSAIKKILDNAMEQ